MAYSANVGPLLRTPDGQLGPPSYRRTVTVPDSVKRPYPVDPFAACTPRTVLTSAEQPAVYIQISKGFGNKPVLGFLYCGKESTFQWTSELNECRMKLAAKIKGQKVNLAQAMIEYRQSAELFYSLCYELHSGYRSLKYGHFRGTLKSLNKTKEASKKWIELQFGVLPVVSDLEGLCDSLALGLRDGVTQQVTQSVKGRYKMSVRSYRDPIGDGTLVHTEREDFSVRMKARYKIQDVKVQNVARFGFFNVPALAYELVPFSFVIDWAIGVGDWLQTLDALHGIQELVYSQGTHIRWSGQTDGNGGTASNSTVNKTRTQSLTGLPVNFPIYEPSDSLKKVVTGLALIKTLRN